MMYSGAKNSNAPCTLLSKEWNAEIKKGSEWVGRVGT